MIGRRSSYVPIFLAIILIYIIHPFYVWPLVNMPVVNYSIVGICYLFFILNASFADKTNVVFFVFFSFVIFVIVLLSGGRIGGMIMTLPVAFIPFINKILLKDTYKYFLNIYSVLIGISILVWMFILIGIDIPSYTIEPINKIKSYNYLAYPFLLVPNTIENIRFHALFDEPGVVGTYAIMFLFIERFNLKKWQNIIILISGLVSLSLFFYLAFLISMVFYVIKTRKTYLKIFFIVFVFAFYITINNENNKILYENIGSRMQYDQNSKRLMGDNRSSEELDIFVKSIRWSEEYWFGIARNNTELLRSFSGSAGYKMAILYYGVIGCLLYLLFFYMYARSRIKNQKDFIIFYLMFVLILYQRPGIFNIIYVFLFAAWINEYSSKKILVMKGQNP